MRSLPLRCSVVFGVLVVLACQKKTASEGAPVDLVAKGKSVYQANCLACHSSDPRVAGALGPEIAKPSFELLEERVLKGSYPTNYKPKRTSKVMQPLPQLKDDLPALHAYLNSL